jgi:predicted nucleotide-binding protein
LNNLTTSSPPSPLLDRLRASYKRGLVLVQSKQHKKNEIQLWFNSLRIKLQDIYGNTAPIIKLYREKIVNVYKNGITTDEFTSEVAQLKRFIDQLEYSAETGCMNPISTASAPPASKNVFIIHGHDELNTHRLTLLLQNNLKVNPIVIISKPGMSRPLIDKYEDSASLCTFAFALVTPDDIIKTTSSTYAQARPNVIFELGWFIGRLGKHRVVILLKEGTTVHSDIDGVSRIQFRDNVEEKFLDIQKELIAAGLI